MGRPQRAFCLRGTRRDEQAIRSEILSFHLSMSEDYYATLGVKRGASADEIRKAYRELARKYHPDLNRDDAQAQQRFKDVQKAFDVLNDAKKREMYDRYGSDFEAFAGAQAGPRHGRRANQTGGQSFEFNMDDLEDMLGGRGGPSGRGFADIFKQFQQPGARRQQAAQRGQDIEHELTVPFATSVNGGHAQISVRRSGSKVESLDVKIPAGIDDGKKIRLRGQGEPGQGDAPAGDILITIRVSPHPSFQRRGMHLDVKVPVTLAEALSGGKIDLPTPSGTISLSVPPCSSSGKKLRIKGHGVHRPDGSRGDLFAELQIVLPGDLSPSDADDMAQIADKYPSNPRADLQW